MLLKYLSAKKRQGKCSSEKNLVTSEKLVTFTGPIFKIKRAFMSGTVFFQRNVVHLVWGSSN